MGLCGQEYVPRKLEVQTTVHFNMHNLSFLFVFHISGISTVSDLSSPMMWLCIMPRTFIIAFCSSDRTVRYAWLG